jgi:hypothetical protein
MIIGSPPRSLSWLRESRSPQDPGTGDLGGFATHKVREDGGQDESTPKAATPHGHRHHAQKLEETQEAPETRNRLGLRTQPGQAPGGRR